MKIENYKNYEKSIQKVLKFITDEFDKVTNEKFVNNFLKSLLKNDVNSLRLLICLGIDIKTYRNKFNNDATPYLAYLELIKKVILETQSVKTPKTFNGDLSSVLKFWLALQNIKIQDRKPKIETLNKGEFFSRIMTLEVFFKFVVYINKEVNNPPNKLISYDPTEFESYKLKFNEGAYRKLNISKLGSKTGWVFVGEKDEFDLIFKQENKRNTEDKLIELIDRLGIYFDKEVDCVVLNYPNDFTEITFQPATVNGDWNVDVNKQNRHFSGNEFFMSYRDYDSWGRTFSVSGKNHSLKERVHSEFDYLKSNKKKYYFNIEYLGKITNFSLKKIKKADTEIILKEVINRFEMI